MEPLPITGADSKLHPVGEPPSGETDYNIVFVVWHNATYFHVGHLPCTPSTTGFIAIPRCFIGRAVRHTATHTQLMMTLHPLGACHRGGFYLEKVSSE